MNMTELLKVAKETPPSNEQIRKLRKRLKQRSELLGVTREFLNRTYSI